MFKDGVTHSPSHKSSSASEPRSKHALEKHQRFSYPSHLHAMANCDQRKRRAATACPRPQDQDLEWVVLDAKSVTDSGTCSGGSLDSSLDIDIGNFSTQVHSKREI